MTPEAALSDVVADNTLRPLEPNRNLDKALDVVSVFYEKGADPLKKMVSVELAHRVVYNALLSEGHVTADEKVGLDISDDQVIDMAFKTLVWARAKKRVASDFAKFEAKYNEVYQIKKDKPKRKSK